MQRDPQTILQDAIAAAEDIVDTRLVYGLARTRLPALLAALRAAR
jgi:hypothetical protein